MSKNTVKPETQKLEDLHTPEMTATLPVDTRKHAAIVRVDEGTWQVRDLSSNVVLPERHVSEENAAAFARTSGFDVDASMAEDARGKQN